MYDSYFIYSELYICYIYIKQLKQNNWRGECNCETLHSCQMDIYITAAVLFMITHDGTLCYSHMPGQPGDKTIPLLQDNSMVRTVVCSSLAQPIMVNIFPLYGVSVWI